MENKTSIASQTLIRGYFHLYPAEAAKSLNNLTHYEMIRMLKTVPLTDAARVYNRLNIDFAVALISSVDDHFFTRLFSLLDEAYIANLFSRLDDDMVKRKLALLPQNLAYEIKELMAYPQNTAGRLMDPQVTHFWADETVDAVLNRLRTIQNRRIVDLCIVNNQGRLIAVIPLRMIIVSPPEEKLGNLIQGQPASIHALAPREDVVQLMDEKKLVSLPVVDHDGNLLGVIRYDALVSAAQQNASEDIQAMFGAGRDERALSSAPFAVKKRLPWLQVNLVTAFLAAFVVGLFEDTIARMTALAVFLPVVAGQSGNTGSQALAVTMRGLALREIRVRHWLQIARKEVAVGFLNGVAVALTTSLVAYIWMKSQGLALVIGISMVFSMIIAGLSGAIIPIVLKTFGQDPAQSSSIILTTVTDVVGFLSFLGLATLMSRFLTIG